MNVYPIRVFHVEDHAILREGIQLALSAYKDIVLVGGAGNAQDALAQIATVNPHVVLLDISLPDQNGLAIIPHLRAAVPALGILVLSMHDEAHFGVRSLKSGADGYLNKSCSTATLTDAIRRLNEGRKYVSQTLAELLANAVDPQAEHCPQVLLTSREMDVFLGIVKGTGLTTIAHALGLSVKTISTHRTRILEKTRCTSNADLVRLAIEYRALDESEIVAYTGQKGDLPIGSGSIS
jgi:two-component system, NarL family, invasion response regulator UvrY